MRPFIVFLRYDRERDLWAVQWDEITIGEWGTYADAYLELKKGKNPWNSNSLKLANWTATK